MPEKDKLYFCKSHDGRAVYYNKNFGGRHKYHRHVYPKGCKGVSLLTFKTLAKAAATCATVNMEYGDNFLPELIK